MLSHKLTHYTLSQLTNLSEARRTFLSFRSSNIPEIYVQGIEKKMHLS